MKRNFIFFVFFVFLNCNSNASTENNNANSRGGVTNYSGMISGAGIAFFSLLAGYYFGRESNSSVILDLKQRNVKLSDSNKELNERIRKLKGDNASLLTRSTLTEIKYNTKLEKTAAFDHLKTFFTNVADNMDYLIDGTSKLNFKMDETAKGVNNLKDITHGLNGNVQELKGTVYATKEFISLLPRSLQSQIENTLNNVIKSNKRIELSVADNNTILRNTLLLLNKTNNQTKVLPSMEEKLAQIFSNLK